jgi:hypothetical protein
MNMDRRDDRRRDNDALQSGEGDLAIGQDEREFGAGGQVTQGPLGKNDAPNRDPDRDESVPGAKRPASRKKEQAE